MIGEYAGTSLFYPYLSVRDEWLKASLLYWDRVRRIVPIEAQREVHDKHDSPEARMATEAELLVSTPASDYLEPAATRFRKKIFPLLNTPEHSINLDAKFFLTLPDPGDLVTKVHANKISYRLAHELESKGVGRRAGDWILLPDEAAALYMVCLASEMASRLNVPLVTDTPQFENCGEYLLFGDAPAKNDNLHNSVLARIGVEFPTPNDVAALSMAKLLKFRAQRADERQRFRHAVEEISVKASSIGDPLALQDFCNDKKNEINAAINDHRKALDELKVKTIVSALAISVPTLISPAVSVPIIGASSAAALTGGAIEAVRFTYHSAQTDYK